MSDSPSSPLMGFAVWCMRLGLALMLLTLSLVVLVVLVPFLMAIFGTL